MAADQNRKIIIDMILQPTYSVLEIHDIVGNLDREGLQILSWLVNEEKKRYGAFEIYQAYWMINNRTAEISRKKNKL